MKRFFWILVFGAVCSAAMAASLTGSRAPVHEAR